MATNVTGKVAKLITANELVLNKGSSSGIKAGWKVWIFDESVSDIKDPDTGEDLGQLPRYSVQLDVVTVGERASIARRRVMQSSYAQLLKQLETGHQTVRPDSAQPVDSWPEGVVIGSRFIAQGDE